MPTKPAIQSATLWFNVIIGVYEVLAQTGFIAALPPDVAAVILVVGNLLLRFKTKQPVSLL